MRAILRAQPTALAFVLVLVLIAGACGGGNQNGNKDSGPGDAPATTDTPPATDTPVVDDAGTPDTAPDMDGGVMDAGPECAPPPTGGPTPSGAAPMYDGGPTVATTATRPELSQQVADDKYTIRKALAQGNIINGGVPPDGGVGPVTYSAVDNWDPLSNGIGDVSTFTPTYTVAASGGTHTTLHTAFNDANFLAGCGRVYIRMMPGEYRMSAVLNSKASAPQITLYSTESDASKVVIVNNLASATAGSMTNSATLTIKAVKGFQMKNVTVANDYVEGSAMGNQNAVAMLLHTEQAQFENVRFLGNISTLYVKSVSETTAARSYFRDCYIEGDEEFIVGRGTAVFDHCEIKSLGARKPTGGTIGSPSTLVFNGYGFLFDSCNFTAEAGVTGVFLGKQWPEESDLVRGMAVGKMIVRNSILGAHLAGAAPWAAAHTSTPKNPVDGGTTPIVVYTSDDYFPAGVGPTPAEPFIAEYRNSGPGAHQ